MDQFSRRRREFCIT